MSSPRVRIRPLEPGDVDTVRRVFEGLSARSRHHRFHAPIRRLADGALNYLAAAGPDHIVLVAEGRGPVGWTPAGLGRAVRTGADEAEVGLEVADAWQGRGIGRRLLEQLGEIATSQGVHTLTGTVLDQNQPMRHLWHSVFPATRAVRNGSTWQLRTDVPAPADRRRQLSTRYGQRPPTSGSVASRNLHSSQATRPTTRQGAAR